MEDPQSSGPTRKPVLIRKTTGQRKDGSEVTLRPEAVEIAKDSTQHRAFILLIFSETMLFILYNI